MGDRRRAKNNCRWRTTNDQEEREEDVHREEEDFTGESGGNNEVKTDVTLEREELEKATALSMEAAHQHTNALTAEALMRSKEDSMLASCALKCLDTVLFRLTRCA